MRAADDQHHTDNPLAASPDVRANGHGQDRHRNGAALRKDAGAQPRGRPFHARIATKFKQVRQSTRGNPRETESRYTKQEKLPGLSIIDNQVRFYLDHRLSRKIGWLCPEVIDPIPSLVDGHFTSYTMPWYSATDLQTLLLSDETSPSVVPLLARAPIEIALWTIKVFLFDRTALPLRNDEREAYRMRFLDGKLKDRHALAQQMIRGSASFKTRRYLREATLALLNARRVVLNGRELLPAAEVLSRIVSRSAVCDALFPPTVGAIFGDCHNENILVAFEHDELVFMKLIDARGFPYPADIAYEVAKVLHAVRGWYDFIHRGLLTLPLGGLDFDSDRFSVPSGWCPVEAKTARGRGGSIDEASKATHTQLQRRMAAYSVVDAWLVKDFLPELLDGDPTWELRARFHTAMHFLTMIPHHVNDEPDIVWLLYLRGLELLNDFWESLTDAG